MSESRPQGGPQGPTLGRYHLAEAIGGGPTGEVFRAKVYGVAGFERQFAVKRFWKQICEEPSRLSVIAEAARRYQTIEHPRIARLHEYGVIDAQAFVAVELVPGVDLARFIAFTHGLGAPVPPGATLSLVAQLARAVAYAQGRGVPHLGICPTNVVCTPDGDVKVLDFGFLRARLTDKPVNDWSLLARLPYLAPEQLRGSLTTPATDVFQLATLAFEMLTGKRAFNGTTPMEVAESVAAASPAPELLPPGVGDVLSRAHAARPEDRWSNAGAFADYLEAAMRRSPQTGGRSDIAAAVRRTMQRVQEMEANQVSGALSFPLPSPPPSLQGLAPVVSDAMKGAPSASAAGTPPPVPVTPPAVPSLRSLSTPGVPVVSAGAGAGVHEAPTRVASDAGATAAGGGNGELELELPEAESPEPTFAGETIPGPRALSRDDRPSVPDLATLGSVRDDDEPRTDLHVPLSATGATPVVSTSAPPEPLPSPPTGQTPPLGDDALTTARPRAAGGGAGKRAVLVIGVLAILGGGGYFAFQHFASKAETTARPGGGVKGGPKEKPPKGPKEKPPVTEAADAGAGAVAPAADAGAVAVATPPDAAPVAIATPPDAGAVAVVTPSDKLRFESNPPGAQLYIDGAPKGMTPVDLPGSGDKHKVALVLRGHKLYRGDADGSGLVKIDLEAIPEQAGEGKIKVRCKTKDRLYIIINGVDTGELCPSERIYTPLGEVTIDLYDPVSDTTTSHKIVVKPSKGSQRVHLTD